MTIAAIQHRSDEFSQDAKPAGYVEYEARTSLRELIALYGIEGARLLVAEIFKDEARRSR